MKTKLFKAVLFTLLFTGAVVLIFVYKNTSFGGAHSSVLFIKKHFNGRGEIADLQEEVFVRGKENDIAWYETDKNIEIRYGKVKLKYSKEDIIKKDVINDLKSIFIEFKKNDNTGAYIMYYRGNRIEKSVKL